MSYKTFDVNSYVTRAQENFSGADGDWSNLTDPSMSADGGEWGYMTDPSMSADGGHFADAPEYSFTITSTSTNANATVVLFGAAIYTSPTVTNYGSSTGVTITPFNGVSYWQMLQDSQVEPFTVGKIRIQCSSAAQVQQSILMTSTNAQGESYTSPLNIITAVTPYQYNNQIAEYSCNKNVTKDVYFSFTMLGSGNPSLNPVTITFYLKRKVNTARGLQTGTVGSSRYGAPNMGIRPVMIGSQGGLRTLG